MNSQFFHYRHRFDLEAGGYLPELTIAYNSWGRLNHNRNNVIWISHALTANSDACEWWPGMIGPGAVFDTDRYFVICANFLGSCYGTTGPLSINPKNDSHYGHSFPMITIRDMVMAHELLRAHLQIVSIHLLVGGSMGGYQALEWSIINPLAIQNMVLIATSAKETAWGIAIHTAQRMAIEADGTWVNTDAKAGDKGLAVARAIGMLTYRNYKIFTDTQSEDLNTKLDGFKATSYIRYQSQKLVRRFNAYSYWILTRAMDTHNIARNRESSIIKVLNSIRQSTLVIGIMQDILCPVEEQEFLATYIPGAKLVRIDSQYGHDGFLTETRQIAEQLQLWLHYQKSPAV